MKRVMKPYVGQRVIYKFDRKIFGGTTEQRVGRAKDAIKVEGLEAEGLGIVTKVHDDGTLDLEVVAGKGGGAYTFRRVANGSDEGQWRWMTSAGEAAAAPTEDALTPTAK